MSTEATLFEKIWRRHVVADLGEGFTLLHVDRHVLQDFNGNAFVPTTGEQVEAGVKYQPTGNRVLATLAVYKLVQENTLVVDPNHTLYSIQQGETEVQGVELEGRWNIGNGLSVYGAYAYTDSEVTRSK